MQTFSLPVPIHPEVQERIERLELSWNDHGVDHYGVDKRELARFFSGLRYLYRGYFRNEVYGLDNVPDRGRAMVVGNHSGGLAIDGGMVIASLFLDKDPPRLAQGMADKFIARLPFASQISSRIGQFPGLPENAARLLEDERLLMVFPEGVRGTAKLYAERDSLVRFGTGFVRLALETGSPIVPFAFVGAGEAVPTIANLYRLGKTFGVPYVPITPWLFPVPLPTDFQLLYGAPMRFEGDGSEPDEVIEGYVEQVKSRIAKLLREGRSLREGRMNEAELDLT